MDRSEMGKYIKKITPKIILVGLIFIVILYLGNSLRFYNYDVVPHPAETADEYDFAWVGLSLIQDGVPVGWTSIVSGYENIWTDRINVDNIYDSNPKRKPFTMTKPWFDKPPGLALIVGSYSYLKGAREFYQAGVGIIRRPMIRIAALSTFLIFIFATRLYGKWVGLLSALLYSVIPTTVISSRLVLAENAYIPLFLGALIVTDVYRKKHNRSYLIIAGVLSALAVFMKLSGVAVLLSVILIVLVYGNKKKKVNDALLVFSVGSLGIVLFVLFGAYYDLQVFWKVLLTKTNFTYGAGADVILSLVAKSKITARRFLTDGWITAGWISAFIVSFSEWKKSKATTILSIALFSYLFVFLLFGGQGYGWYRFPFLVLLVVFLSRLLVRLFNEPNLFVFTPVLLLPIGTSLHRLFGIQGFGRLVFPFRIILVSVFLVFILLSTINKKYVRNLYKSIFLTILGLAVYLAVREILFFNYDNWFFVT